MGPIIVHGGPTKPPGNDLRVETPGPDRYFKSSIFLTDRNDPAVILQ